MSQQASRTFRIFVSSTFSDLKAERNALQEKVFPRLRDLATANHCRFQAIDLRWGVSDEAGLDQQTMKICLSEIERCQKTKLKPNFIILLGDRYGWCPLPYEIPADEFDTVLTRVTEQEELLLKRWYCLDKNAVPKEKSIPGVYCLLPRQAGLSSIPDLEYKRMSEDKEVESSLSAIDRWYKIGQAAEPVSVKYFGSEGTQQSAHILQPIDEHPSEEDKKERSFVVRKVEGYFWQGIEGQLHNILENATQDFSAETRMKYSASATEQEIVQGALQVEEANKHVFAFFRNIDNLDDLKAVLLNDLSKSDTDSKARDYIDTLDKVTCDEKSHQCQETLKNTLRGEDHLGEDNIRPYPAHWNGNGVTEDHIGSELIPDNLDELQKKESQLPSCLCVDVWRRLSKVIISEAERLEKEDEKIDALARENEAHLKFGEDRINDFVGREEILEAISAYIDHKSDDSHPLVIYGESGIGKTTLMKKAAEQTKGNCILRQIGATPDSSNGRFLLENLCKEISRRYGSDESNVPSEYKDLVLEFPKRLSLATQNKPLIIFLDALDQLSDADNARSLVWLPAELPANVGLIVSTLLPGECFDTLKGKVPETNFLKMKPMTKDEARAVLQKWFSRAERKLQDEQMDYLLEHFNRVRFI